MARRSQIEEVSEYIRSRLRAELEAGAGVRRFAESVGTSHVTIINIRERKTKIIDSSLLDGFARHFKIVDEHKNPSLPKMFELAHAWAKEHEHLFDAAPPRVVPEERYSNRELAAEFARRDGVPEEAIRMVLGDSLQSATDRSPQDWLDDMRAEQRLLQRRRLSPPTAAQTAKEKAAADERAREAARRPGFEERLQKAAARRRPAPKKGKKS